MSLNYYPKFRIKYKRTCLRCNPRDVMKPYTYLFIHCTASPEGVELSADAIKQMHLSPYKNKDGSYHYMGRDYLTIDDLPSDFIGGISVKKLRGRGWKQVGYSVLIHLNGNAEILVNYNEDNFITPDEITNGATGFNGVSRHIVYVGGCDKAGKPKDTRTPLQTDTLRNLVITQLKIHPNLIIIGHNQVAAKACPSFDVPNWLRSIGVNESNIYKV